MQSLLTEFSGPHPHQLQNVYVQPSQRIFPDGQYEAAGATISESLEDADVLLGVKVCLYGNILHTCIRAFSFACLLACMSCTSFLLYH